jgi:hypothetical protein
MLFTSAMVDEEGEPGSEKIPCLHCTQRRGSDVVDEEDELLLQNGKGTMPE